MQNRADQLKQQLSSCLENKLSYFSLLAESCAGDMKSTIIRRIDRLSHAAEKAALTLEENNPIKILEKGYSIIEDTDGSCISSFRKIAEGGRYRLIFKDGSTEITASSVKERG